jgi:hypothetical protein
MLRKGVEAHVEPGESTSKHTVKPPPAKTMNQGDSPRAGQPETPKLPHAVFISYSNEDKVLADAVCGALLSWR